MRSGQIPWHRCHTFALYGTLQREVSTVFPMFSEGFTVTVRCFHGTSPCQAAYFDGALATRAEYQNSE